jgi:hypothetical protein
MPNLYLENGEQAGLFDVIDWFLEHYEGVEHLTIGGSTSPETWYTVTTILKRALEKINHSQKG